MRAASTYRGAPTRIVPQVAARYVPYQIKPPVLKRAGINWDGKPLFAWTPRKQPNIYPVGWRTKAERAAGPRQ